MSNPPTPNRALRAVLAETGWTGAALAREVNKTSAEAGLSLALDRRAVSFWLAGRRPHPPLPDLIAEALSRSLGRQITIDDIGLGNREGSSTDEAAAVLRQAARGSPAIGVPDPPVFLTELARRPDRRRALVGGVYSVALLAVPAWAQCANRRHGTMTRPAEPVGRVTAGQVATAEGMTRLFTDSDSAFGGGRARAVLTDYLAHGIAPLLRCAASPALRGRLCRAAAQLTYLCGFMCFDDEQHGLAQRYYRTVLELAGEAGDPGVHAAGLRAMSVQAFTLGHCHQARDLAEAAFATGRARATLMQDAFLLGQVAVAAAAEGDRTAALAALSGTERWVDQATSGIAIGAAPSGRRSPRAATNSQSAIGNYHRGALAYQEAAVRALLGDRAGAITALETSLRHRPPGERRSRAITRAKLVDLHLAGGHLDQAVASWRGFLEDYRYLSSGRAARALREIRSRLLPYSTNPAVKEVMLQAVGLSPAFNRPGETLRLQERHAVGRRG